jgi:hypothetical protein
VPRRGRILAIKWGLNPNSSSLGVDVTFLLVGATALAMVTPVIGALLRRRARRAAPAATAPGPWSGGPDPTGDAADVAT